MAAASNFGESLGHMASKKLGIAVTGLALLHAADAPTWQILALAGAGVIAQAVSDIVDKIVHKKSSTTEQPPVANGANNGTV